MEKELAKQLLASINRDAQTLHDLAELTGDELTTGAELTTVSELTTGGRGLLNGIDKATAALRGLFAEHPDGEARVGAEKALDELERRSHRVAETLAALPT